MPLPRRGAAGDRAPRSRIGGPPPASVTAPPPSRRHRVEAGRRGDAVSVRQDRGAVHGRRPGAVAAKPPSATRGRRGRRRSARCRRRPARRLVGVDRPRRRRRPCGAGRMIGAAVRRLCARAVRSDAAHLPSAVTRKPPRPRTCVGAPLGSSSHAQVPRSRSARSARCAVGEQDRASGAGAIVRFAAATVAMTPFGSTDPHAGVAVGDQEPAAGHVAWRLLLAIVRSIRPSSTRHTASSPTGRRRAARRRRRRRAVPGHVMHHALRIDAPDARAEVDQEAAVRQRRHAQLGRQARADRGQPVARARRAAAGQREDVALRSCTRARREDERDRQQDGTGHAANHHQAARPGQSVVHPEIFRPPGRAPRTSPRTRPASGRRRP